MRIKYIFKQQILINFSSSDNNKGIKTIVFLLYKIYKRNVIKNQCNVFIGGVVVLQRDALPPAAVRDGHVQGPDEWV